MKRLIIVAVTAAVVCSCAKEEPKSPLELAIEQKAVESVADHPYTFKITKLELLDSTTFRTEFERRTKVFQVRFDQNNKLFQRYMKEGLRENAMSKVPIMRKDRNRVAALDSMKTRMGDSIDMIAYYDYLVSADVTVDKQTLDFEDVYFAITPDNRILSMTKNKKDLHKATGFAIPGYDLLLKSWDGTGDQLDETPVE